MASFVRIRYDVLLSHNWDKIIYSVHKHDFELPWLVDVNHGLTAIFHWLFFYDINN